MYIYVHIYIYIYVCTAYHRLLILKKRIRRVLVQYRYICMCCLPLLDGLPPVVYIYIYTHICIYIYGYVYIYSYIHMYIYVHIYIYVCTAYHRWRVKTRSQHA